MKLNLSLGLHDRGNGVSSSFTAGYNCFKGSEGSSEFELTVSIGGEVVPVAIFRLLSAANKTRM